MKISDLSENDCKPVFVIVISGLLIAFAAFFLMHQNVVAIISLYNSGYAHGCDDAKAGDHPYLNSPGHGANFHTGQFMEGYNDGFNGCGGNQGPPDSARSHHYNQGQLDCYYGRVVPGTHTPDYIAGCKEGTHQRTLSPPVSPPSPTPLQNGGAATNKGLSGSPRAQQYNQGSSDCYYGRVVPGTHTPDYIAGCKEGTHQRTVSPPLPEEQSTKPPVHTNDNYKDYYEGYHDGAVSADFEYDNGMGLGFHGCPPNHSQEYCVGYENGYNDEGKLLA
jgi:hypothetical protein